MVAARAITAANYQLAATAQRLNDSVTLLSSVVDIDLLQPSSPPSKPLRR